MYSQLSLVNSLNVLWTEYRGPGKTFNAVQNYFDGKNATWGKERKGKVWEHEKWHKNIYFATVMRPSWDLFWFLFRENTHCLITDFKSTVNTNTLMSSVHKGFTIPPAKQNHLLYRTFLFLSWLWQNKLTNQNHGLNRQSKTPFHALVIYVKSPWQGITE